MNFSKHLNFFAVIPVLTLAVSACSGGGSSSSTLPNMNGSSVGPAPAGAAVQTVSSSPVTSATSTSKSVAVLRAKSSASHSLANVPGELAHSADSLPGDHDAKDNFIDSIGVNTKLNAWGGSAYSNYPAVKAALLSLGVRHIRDSLSTQGLNNYENNLADLANSGVHSVLGLTIAPDANNNAIINVTGTQAAAYLQAGHYSSTVEAVEGINEPDVNQNVPNGPSPNGWVTVAQNEQRNLYNGVQALTFPARKIPVYGPSVAVNSSHLAQIGDLSQYMDYGNIHDYTGGYDLPGATITGVLTTEQSLSGNKPVVATENGYSTGTTGQAMPDLIMLDYAQRLFYKQYTNNVKRTLWYEFLDESNTPNDYWHNSGLMTSTFAPKPAYTGLKNIITLLKDQTPYTARQTLNFSFGGQIQFENIEHLLLQKNDGSFWLVVWRDVSEWSPANNGSPGSYPIPAPTTVPNALNFLGTYVSAITEYDEDDTGTMSSKSISVTAGSTAQISIGARPRIFKILPGVAPVVPTAPVISNPAAHWSLDEGSGFVAVDSVNPVGNMTVPSGNQASWVSGKYSSGLNVSGTQAYTNAAPIDTTQSYSATAWIQMNTLNGYQAAVAVNGVNQASFAIDFTPQSNISFTTYSSDSSSTRTTRIGSTIVPSIGQWYPVAVTFNGTTRLMSLYINGALQSTAIASAVFKATGGTEIGSILQGGVGHYQWWNGGIDEVNLYQRELSAAEIHTMAGQ